ncbi:MAG: hypothetical protein [Bacteriophage sp.]|nr:MAG: hypothetical protein [Bacteriophage sp.]
MPRKDKVIHISNLPSTFRGNITRNGRFIQNGILPLGGAYDKVAKSTGLIRLGNEFLYNGVNNLVSKDNREKLMNNTAGRLINYVKDFNKESFPSDDELGPTFPFNIIQTPRSNGKKLPQKQYAVGGKVPNVVAGGIAQPLGNNFFYMNGRKHSQGGIDIGPSDKTGIEVEGGEVVETNGNELKVYSAQPIINGVSPAKLVMGGANPNKVFKAQEDFKDINKINDDGTIKAMGGLSRDKDYSSKKKPYPSVAKKDFAGGHRSYPIPTKADAIDALRLAGLHGRSDVKAKVYNKYPELRKKGSNGLIVSISGNVKNGLLHFPSSTGGRHDKLRDGGRRTNPDSLKADRLWSDRQINKIRYLTDLRNSTRNIIAPTGYKVTDIHRTNEPGRYSLAVNIPNQDSINVNIPLRNLPASNIPKGEEYIEKLIEANRKLNLKSDRSNYTRGYDGRVYFKSWINGKSGEINYGTNDFYNQTRSGKNALENARPQYYAERELPLFDDGPAITSGLIRAGWSHGNNKNITVDNTNIPNLPATKSKGNTPRRGRNKSSQSVQSISTKTPPTAVYNRNLPKVEASIPTTLPVSTSTLAKGTTFSDGKGQGRFKNLTTADWIGLGSNVAGSLASYFASKRAINKMRGPSQPTLISASKLKTKYNINPQLDRIREDKFEAYRDIDSNTASSRVSLARKQRVRNAAGQAVNELYGNKENIETNLINQDRRNQQSVRQFNAQQYNQYIDRKTAFDNGIREAKVTNINNLFSGINAGIQDMISRYENRKALNNTIGAMRASAPNVDDRIMRDAGVDYDEFIIRKRRKLGGKQSCR